jgi:hypothetical protein
LASAAFGGILAKLADEANRSKERDAKPPICRGVSPMIAGLPSDF